MKGAYPHQQELGGVQRLVHLQMDFEVKHCWLHLHAMGVKWMNQVENQKHCSMVVVNLMDQMESKKEPHQGQAWVQGKLWRHSLLPTDWEKRQCKLVVRMGSLCLVEKALHPTQAIHQHLVRHEGTQQVVETCSTVCHQPCCGSIVMSIGGPMLV